MKVYRLSFNNKVYVFIFEINFIVYDPFIFKTERFFYGLIVIHLYNIYKYNLNFRQMTGKFYRWPFFLLLMSMVSDDVDLSI